MKKNIGLFSDTLYQFRGRGIYQKKSNFSYKSLFLLFLILSIIILFIVYLSISHINTQKAKNDDVLLNVVNKIRGLHPIIENISFQRADKSYTINKSKVHICIYDENGEPYPLNMLVYVTIHELAHVITKSIGHTDEFYKNFDYLLDKATSKGMYDPTIPLIQNYCGHK